MNRFPTLRPLSLFARTTRLSRLVPAFALAIIAVPIAHAATDDAAQRQLREDRERFQREIERQRTESQIQTERARQSADQQRTADELARLRTQQDRQSSELRTLTTTTRTLTESPAPISSRIVTSASAPTPPIATTPESPAVPSTTVATITPDFSVTFLADGNCVIYVKGRSPEVKSPVETEKLISGLLREKKPIESAPAR